MTIATPRWDAESFCIPSAASRAVVTARCNPRQKQLLEIAAREWEHGDVANAADCIRACRARDPGSVIANELLDRLHRFHGGNVDGNDDWLMSPIRGHGG